VDEIGAELRRLERQGDLTAERAAELGEQAALASLDGREAPEQAAALLVELATAPAPELARAGTEGIFRHAVEAMGDAFEPALCDRYVRFFARVIERCRALPAAGWLDKRLRGHGLTGEADLIARARSVRRLRRARLRSEAVRKVIVLSRVTLGAEVAVTSVALRKLMRAFPAAEILLLAPRQSGLLFAGETRITPRPVDYPRQGGLLDRLAAWPAVADQVHREIEGCGADEYVVIDPDSRLTQLGMLPVLADESAYYFFESRSYTRPGIETLARLTADWLEESFGGDDQPLDPWLSPPEKATRYARALRRSLAGARWASVSFGAGDNPAKRIEDPFELRLVEALLDAGWGILLDQGAGEEEAARAALLLGQLRAAGRRVAFVRQGEGLPAPDSQVVAWQGSLAGFAAWIATSDLYIGYDSAGGHLAAASGVKTVTIFAGFRWPRMVERWKPSGPGEVRAIVVGRQREALRVLAEVWEAVRD